MLIFAYIYRVSVVKRSTPILLYGKTSKLFLISRGFFVSIFCLSFAVISTMDSGHRNRGILTDRLLVGLIRADDRVTVKSPGEYLMELSDFFHIQAIEATWKCEDSGSI